MTRFPKGLVAVLFAAAILYGLQRTTPFYGDITSPIAVHGKPGEKIDARAFALAIGDIHLARAVKTESFGQARTFTTSGIWVLVEAAATAKLESLTLTSAEWLGSNGIRYVLSQRFSSVPGMLPTVTLEPGLPKPVLMAFEIPEGAVSGGTLLISRFAYTSLDEEAWVDMTGQEATDIHPAIMLGRSGGWIPWTLEAE